MEIHDLAAQAFTAYFTEVKKHTTDAIDITFEDLPHAITLGWYEVVKRILELTQNGNKNQSELDNQ